MDRPRSSSSILACILLLGLLIAGLIPALQSSLILESGQVSNGQWWRMITGHFVHIGLGHSVINLLAMLALLVWARLVWLLVPALVFLLLSPLFLSLFLLQMGFEWYAGLSGILHGLVVLLLLTSSRGIRIVGLVLLIGKFYWQLRSGISVMGAAQITALQEAHWAGAALGGVYYYLMRILVTDKRHNRA